MSSYGTDYLYEIRQRAVNVYQNALGRAFDDLYIGVNHIRYEPFPVKGKSLKIRAINERQLRALAYFLYTFTPLKVITLIDDVLNSDETINELNKRLPHWKRRPIGWQGGLQNFVILIMTINAAY